MSFLEYTPKERKRHKCSQTTNGDYFPQSTLSLNMRCLFEENPLMKIFGSPWKEGEIRLEVDKILLIVADKFSAWS